MFIKSPTSHQAPTTKYHETSSGTVCEVNKRQVLGLSNLTWSGLLRQKVIPKPKNCRRRGKKQLYRRKSNSNRKVS